MQRDDVAQLCESEVLDAAANLFGTSKAALGKFDDYEGCANLVYQDEEIQAGLRYKLHCIENDIPYLGFFDSIISPERPFEL